jgi:hypothetical protein
MATLIKLTVGEAEVGFHIHVPLRKMVKAGKKAIHGTAQTVADRTAPKRK